MIAVERLMHATEYWKKVGWLDSGLAQGWVSQALRVYLLGHFLAQDYPLPQLSEAEGLAPRQMPEVVCDGGKYGCFPVPGKMGFCLLPFACRLPEGAGWLSRALWKFLSRCRGRRAVITKYAGDCLPEGRENCGPGNCCR